MPQKAVRILIADDDREMRNLLAIALRNIEGIEIVTAADGVEALEALKKENFDLVVCDWFMPHMKGIQLLCIMRAEKQWKKIPFIMVTAEATPSDITEAVKAGCDDYILKPFPLSLLQERVRKLLR